MREQQRGTLGLADRRDVHVAQPHPEHGDIALLVGGHRRADGWVRFYVVIEIQATETEIVRVGQGGVVFEVVLR